MRRRIFLLLLAGLIAAPAVRLAAQTMEARDLITSLDQALLAVMKAGPSTPFPQRYAMLAPIIERVFDLPGILRTSVGPHWGSLSQQDQTALLEVFRRFTVASYVANFDSFDGQRFEVLPEVRDIAGGEVVATELIPQDGKPVRLDYVMHQEADGWKAVDVLMDGTISRVAVQRSDFRGLLGAGTDAGGLIASLQQKVADLSRGTLPAG